MTLAEAYTLRDEIRKAGWECTVPPGWGVNSFVRVVSGWKAIRLQSREQWLEWKKQQERGGKV